MLKLFLSFENLRQLSIQRRVFGSGQMETPGPTPTGMRESPTMLTMRLKFTFTTNLSDMKVQKVYDNIDNEVKFFLQKIKVI